MRLDRTEGKPGLPKCVWTYERQKFSDSGNRTKQKFTPRHIAVKLHNI